MSFPKFPKKGDILLFKKEYPFNYETPNNNYTKGSIDPGESVEILKTSIETNGYSDTRNYTLFLGLEKYSRKLVVVFDYTNHFNKIEIIPKTQASEVLYSKRGNEKIQKG